MRDGDLWAPCVLAFHGARAFSENLLISPLKRETSRADGEVFAMNDADDTVKEFLALNATIEAARAGDIRAPA